MKNMNMSQKETITETKVLDFVPKPKMSDLRHRSLKCHRKTVGLHYTAMFIIISAHSYKKIAIKV